MTDLEPLVPKKAKVIVTARSLDREPWVGFTMVAEFPDGGGKKVGDDELEFFERAGPFELSFKLDDETDLNLAFYGEFTDAMWVAVGTECPTGPGDGDGAITMKSLSNLKLVVTNANCVKQILTYMLRFIGDWVDEDHPPFEYDPRITNGGRPPLAMGDDDEDEDEDEDEQGDGKEDGQEVDRGGRGDRRG